MVNQRHFMFTLHVLNHRVEGSPHDSGVGSNILYCMLKSVNVLMCKEFIIVLFWLAAREAKWFYLSQRSSTSSFIAVPTTCERVAQAHLSNPISTVRERKATLSRTKQKKKKKKKKKDGEDAGYNNVMER